MESKNKYLFVNDTNSLLSKVGKPIVRVNDEDRVSTEILGRHEVSLLTGTRATQIEYGDSKIFTNYEGLDNSYMIALKELFDKKCPLTLIREIVYPDHIKHEYWDPSEMVIHPSVVKEWLE